MADVIRIQYLDSNLDDEHDSIVKPQPPLYSQKTRQTNKQTNKYIVYAHENTFDYHLIDKFPRL